MNSFDIYKEISKRTDGDIYIGVVGPVRTGKSTFIKNFMEKLKKNQASRCTSCNSCFYIYKTIFKHCIFDNEIDFQLYENFHK